ncbi:hypothetical protein ACHEXK_07645 [Limnohabitans sp. DCL3]|uniref:hypothetical protein n=1 Tax=Limnohabitans sp. DCL3 TaxID=3374103 RepID=UPI003A8A7310
MRSRSRSLDGAGNFWPGYVDAMSNVVMNLLFLVAMFAISAGILGASQGDSTAADLSASSAARADKKSEGVKNPDVARSSDARLFASATPEAVVPISPPSAGADGLAPAVSAADKPDRSAPSPSPMGAAISSPLPTVYLQLTDAKRAWGGPTGQVVRRQAGPDGLLVQVDLPSGGEPLLELERDSVRALLRASLVASPAQRLRIWSNVAASDMPSRRQAYASLAALRNALVGMGWSPQQIESRLLHGTPDIGADGQRLFILMVPWDAPVAPVSPPLG